jgi:hypothetical protein
LLVLFDFKYWLNHITALLVSNKLDVPTDSESNSEFFIMKFSKAKTHKKIDDNKTKIIVLAFWL